MPVQDDRHVRCYWSPTGDGVGTLVLLSRAATVRADRISLEHACALVTPHLVTVGAPPAAGIHAA